MSTTATDEAVVQPAITWLNMSGDVTITWDDENRDHVLALVRQKMRQGYSFFVLTPRALPLLPNKKTRLTQESQLGKAVGVVVPDEQLAAIVANLGDADVEAVVQKGKAHLSSAPGSRNLATTRRAQSAEEVVRNQCVAVRAIVGG